MSIYDETQPDKTISTSINGGPDILLKESIVEAIDDVRKSIVCNLNSSEVFKKCKITVNLWK